MTPKQEAIAAMRVYAEYGAKALAPLLDERRWCKTASEYERRLYACREAATEQRDAAALDVLFMLSRLHWKQVKAVYSAYWASLWTQQH